VPITVAVRSWSSANGGFVAKYMGDGVLAYFGYPRAHEHDAERAIRAGLALVEAVPKLKTAAAIPLQVRVGIATGLVVVGDLIGAGAAQEQAVVGETPNLAARLQGLAAPGAVVISANGPRGRPFRTPNENDEIVVATTTAAQIQAASLRLRHHRTRACRNQSSGRPPIW
jgi:Adenylate and Guanylate cyclase catalytic domain